MIQLFKTKIHEEAIQGVNDVLRSGWVGLGPKVEEFEKSFAEYIGAPYAVAFSSATAALHVAVKLLNISKVQPVVTTPLTFVSTNHAILYERLPLVFADIDLTTGCLDFGSLRKTLRYLRVGDKSTFPKAMMFMHYGGNIVDLDLLYEIASEYKVTIIEDCAHAAGAKFKDERVGARAKFACFSFHAVKNLPLGDGGMLTTTDEEVANRARTLRWLGINKSTKERTGSTYGWRYEVNEVGFKSYMNDINATIGLGQLPHLDEDNTKRRSNHETYKKAGLPMLPSKPGYAHHLAVMLAKDRQEKENICASLTKRDIQYGVHYLPNYYYPMYKDVMKVDGCVKTEEFYNRCISLPNHLYLSEDELTQIVEVIKEAIT